MLFSSPFPWGRNGARLSVPQPGVAASKNTQKLGDCLHYRRLVEHSLTRCSLSVISQIITEVVKPQDTLAKVGLCHRGFVYMLTEAGVGFQPEEAKNRKLVGRATQLRQEEREQ